MISMIVCSVDPAKLEKFCENVLMTVGCPCEFVVHDNRETGYGITHVYNLCAAKAKGEYLCFAHEDIFFRTPDWGERIVSLLQRPATGGGFCRFDCQAGGLLGVGLDEAVYTLQLYTAVQERLD